MSRIGQGKAKEDRKGQKWTGQKSEKQDVTGQKDRTGQRKEPWDRDRTR